MSIFEKNPYECSDLAGLQEWVFLLQELIQNRHQATVCNHEITQLLKQVNEKQGEKIAYLEEKVELFLERISGLHAANNQYVHRIWVLDQQVEGLKEDLAEYEAVFSLKSQTDGRRMN